MNFNYAESVKEGISTFVYRLIYKFNSYSVVGKVVVEELDISEACYQAVEGLVGVLNMGGVKVFFVIEHVDFEVALVEFLVFGYALDSLYIEKIENYLKQILKVRTLIKCANLNLNRI